MAIFDHEIELRSDWDAQFEELMVDIRVNFIDAFGDKQSAHFCFRDPYSKIFTKDQVVVAGTAMTGARILSGAVLAVRADEVDLISGAQVQTCQWIDDKLPQPTETVQFFESLNPKTGDTALLATRRSCLHPELVSINILVLNQDKDVGSPKYVEFINPFTGQPF